MAIYICRGCDQTGLVHGYPESRAKKGDFTCELMGLIRSNNPGQGTLGFEDEQMNFEFECLGDESLLPNHLGLDSQATKARYLSFLRSLFRAAVNEWRWLGRVPNIKVRQKKEIRVRWLTQEEAARLIKCMPDVIKPVVIFALATGLRRSNILNLEWSQLDLQRKVAWIHPEDAKGGKAIGVALNDTACQVLRNQIGKHNRWVFVHTKA